MTLRSVQIVCTIGPASRDTNTLERLIDAGMRVARLNFAHGTYEQHRETIGHIREAARSRQSPVAILQDLPGPKLRIGELVGGPVELGAGDEVTLVCGSDKAQAPRLAVPDAELAEEIRPGDLVLIGDGAVELRVVAVEPPEIHCQVSVAGSISSGRGLNVPGGLRARPILDDADRASLEFGAELGVDFVGVSYVRRPDDLALVRRSLRSLGRVVPLVAKIETASALEHLTDIVALSDALLIARGDLSLEIPYERVPIEQKRIVREALRAGRPVITATQMLQSMVENARPTRAEATDVANAVLDGTDAVMLSDETAIGIDPVRACSAMARIIEETEQSLPSSPPPEPAGISAELHELVVFSRAAVRIAGEVGVRAIVTWTRGGLAARLLARERPSVPLVAPTRFEDAWRRLALVYGTRPLLCPDGRLARRSLEHAIGPLSDRDLLLVVRHQAGESRRIPWMGLVRVADRAGWDQDPNGRAAISLP
jgi:pyruvate kinase